MGNPAKVSCWPFWILVGTIGRDHLPKFGAVDLGCSVFVQLCFPESGWDVAVLDASELVYADSLADRGDSLQGGVECGMSFGRTLAISCS